MWQQIIPGLRIKLFMTIILGIGYPLLITGICQLMFPYRANGSLIEKNRVVIGSELIGQNFSKPEYFHPRPSAAGTDGYNATASGGSNYGPTNQKLIDRVKASIEKFRTENPTYTEAIPVDLVTASASGLDPHISPASAEAQSDRIARAREVSAAQIRQLIRNYTDAPQLGIIGEARVNVLAVNLALDERFPRR